MPGGGTVFYEAPNAAVNFTTFRNPDATREITKLPGCWVLQFLANDANALAKAIEVFLETCVVSEAAEWKVDATSGILRRVAKVAGRPP